MHLPIGARSSVTRTNDFRESVRAGLWHRLLVALALLWTPASSAGTYAPIIFYNLPNWYGGGHEYIRFPTPEAAATVEWNMFNPPVCPPPLPSSNNYYVYDHIVIL